MFIIKKKNPSFLLCKLGNEEQKKAETTRRKEIRKVKPKSVKLKTEKFEIRSMK